MKSALPFLGLTLLMAVSACDSKKQDAVENAYENKAAAIDNMADNLQNKADNVSAAVDNQVDVLKNKADAVRDAGEAAKDRADNAK
jgi:hypothetical protein